MDIRLDNPAFDTHYGSTHSLLLLLAVLSGLVCDGTLEKSFCSKCRNDYEDIVVFHKCRVQGWRNCLEVTHRQRGIPFVYIGPRIT